MTALQSIRLRVLAIVMIALVTGLAATMPAAAQVDDEAGEAVARLCTISLLGRPPFTDLTCEVAVREATSEAAGWPDYDSIAISEAGHRIELARIEAAGWPDYDSVAISEEGLRIQIARQEAAEEAATWPDYDPSSMADEAQVAGAHGDGAPLGTQD